jgi:hypothetical protein
MPSLPTSAPAHDRVAGKSRSVLSVPSTVSTGVFWAPPARAHFHGRCFSRGGAGRHRRLVVVCGMLVPVIGLVQIGGQARRSLHVSALIGLRLRWPGARWRWPERPPHAASQATRRYHRDAGAVRPHRAWASAVLAQYRRLWARTMAGHRRPAELGVRISASREHFRANGRAAESFPFTRRRSRATAYPEDYAARPLARVRGHGQTARAITALQDTLALKPDAVETRMSWRCCSVKVATARGHRPVCEPSASDLMTPACGNHYTRGSRESAVRRRGPREWDDVCGAIRV